MSTGVYCLENFILSCKNEPRMIKVIQRDLHKSLRYFNLNTEKELLEFIGNGGLEDLAYVNTKPWENNPDKDIKEIFVDAYRFRSGRKIGYMAILKGLPGNYVIKSFHKNYNKAKSTDVGNNSIKPLR